MQEPNRVRQVEQTALLSVQALPAGMSDAVEEVGGSRSALELERVGVLGAPSLIGFMIDQIPPLTSSHRSVSAPTVVPRIFSRLAPCTLAVPSNHDAAVNIGWLARHPNSY